MITCIIVNAISSITNPIKPALRFSQAFLVSVSSPAEVIKDIAADSM